MSPACLPCPQEGSHTCSPRAHCARCGIRPGEAVGSDPAQPSALRNRQQGMAEGQRGKGEGHHLTQHRGRVWFVGRRLHSHSRDLLPSLFGWDLALQEHCSGSERLPEGNKPDRYFAQIIELFLDAQHIHLQDS